MSICPYFLLNCFYPGENILKAIFVYSDGSTREVGFPAQPCVQVQPTKHLAIEPTHCYFEGRLSPEGQMSVTVCAALTEWQHWCLRQTRTYKPQEITMTKSFVFKITYFKLTGKYYTEAKVSWNVRVSDDGTTAYMYDAVAKLRGLRDTGGQSSLPGLSGSWEGFILIECEEGFPCLITPRKE